MLPNPNGTSKGFFRISSLRIIIQYHCQNLVLADRRGQEAAVITAIKCKENYMFALGWEAGALTLSIKWMDRWTDKQMSWEEGLWSFPTGCCCRSGFGLHPLFCWLVAIGGKGDNERQNKVIKLHVKLGVSSLWRFGSTNNDHAAAELKRYSKGLHRQTLSTAYTGSQHSLHRKLANVTAHVRVLKC